MLFLISLIIAVLTAFFLNKPLKKHPTVFYVTAALLTALSVVIMQSGMEVSNHFLREYVIGIFSRGALGGAFWAVVMWAGALPNGSAPIKKLMPIRGELSITAAILTLSHIVTYGFTYISNLIKGRTGSDFAVTSIISIAMVLIMVPLTVMSFKTVRKKMDPKKWKKIQRFAYYFYALIYIHIMVLFIPKAQSGREGYFLSVLVYSAVFIGYAVMRIRKFSVAKKKSDPRLVPNIVSISVVILTLITVASVSREAKHEENAVKAEETSAVFTFAAGTTASAQTTVTSAVSSETTSAVSSSGSTVSATASGTTLSTKKGDEEETHESEDDTETTAVPEEALQEEQPDEEHQETSPEPQQQLHNEEPQNEPDPQVTYQYKNGEYEAEAEGYAGTVHVKLTIENDVITSMSAWADDDDPDYFGDAMNTVIPQIAANCGTGGVDACSGATYSSKGIIEAAGKALEKAKN